MLRALLILGSLLECSLIQAQEHVPAYFLSGVYKLRGYDTGRESGYKGKIIVAIVDEDARKVTIQRMLGGKVIEGTGNIDGSTLRVEFNEGENRLIGRFFIEFDDRHNPEFSGRLYSFGTTSKPVAEMWSDGGKTPEIPDPMENPYEQILTDAEFKASADGQRVLAKAREMTIVTQEILPGSCWDYVNAVFDRAGYPYAKRKTIFKSVKAGPYANHSLIQPGDWLYFINHSYGNVEHSSMFVDWSDYPSKTGFMLSYGGEGRREPARYLDYDLTHVFMIIRPVSR